MNLKVIFLTTILGLLCFLLINISPTKKLSMIENKNITEVRPKNVLGSELQSCCTEPMTGFYRDGFCSTGKEDYGTHVICAVVTEEFLSYSKSMGNDLTRALPEPSTFKGLKPGDKWCLCASRWVEAMKEGHAPKILLESTHVKTLDYVDLETLKKFAH